MARIRHDCSVNVQPENGNFRQLGRFASAEEPIQSEGDVMKKILTALVATASISVAVLAVSSPANAYYRGGGGWHGGGYGYRGGYWGPGAGFVAGALIGGAIAGAPYGYPYGYGGYYPYGGPYAAPCVWRRVWNGYAWVRACV
jgi:hypothetical protein